MALRNILKDGDETLKKISKEVTVFDEKLHKLLDDMRETMMHYNGVGIAAVQVGILKRAVLVLDENEKIIELINPKIINMQETYNDIEGCLSVPGIFGMVDRPVSTTVSATDRYGKEFIITGEDLMSRALCHEIEHLDGHLFKEKVTEYVEVDS